ncbi:hypothetical protein EBR96_05630, partial [bacterium]|nr:hypothetical protein [bacterium]
INEVICNPTTVELNKGDTAAISARVFPSEASQNILWSVLDSRIVSLQAGNTRIRAEKPGVTRVKATSINPNIFSFIEVSVRTPAVTAISISPGSLRFFQGQTVKLTATLTPADANQDVIWSSDDVVVADVDSNGNVTGIQPGTTRIIARSVSNPERTAQVTVTVDSIGITSVSVSPSPLDMNLGNTARLTATVVPSTVSDVKWRSSDPNVVRVSTTGNVTAVGRGLNVTVTATSKADDSKAGSSRLSVGGSGYEYRIIDRSYWIPSIGDNSTKRCVFLTPAEIEVIRSQIPDGEIPWLSEIQTAPSGRARYFYLVVYMEEPRSNQFVYLKSIDFVSSKLQIKVTSVNDPQFPVGQPILSNPAYVRLVVEIDTSLLPLAVNTATPIQYTVE